MQSSDADLPRDLLEEQSTDAELRCRAERQRGDAEVGWNVGMQRGSDPEIQGGKQILLLLNKGKKGRM